MYSTSAVPHGVVRQLVGRVVAEPQVLFRDAQVDVPVVAAVAPILVPGARLAGMAEELHLHLLELARAEGEVPRRDLVAEALADLRDAEGNFHPRAVEHVLEVDEHPLGRLRPQEGRPLFAGQGADDRLEHQVEFARLGELALLEFAGMLARLERAFAGLHVVGPEAGLALAAIDHHVVEQVVVAGALPDLRMHDDRRLDADHGERLRRTGQDRELVVVGDQVVVPGVCGRSASAPFPAARSPRNR